MTPRERYIDKLHRIAEKQNQMSRAFVLAKAKQAEKETDEQYCKTQKVKPDGV